MNIQPMTIADRKRFVQRFLHRYEPQGHRWIGIPKQDADKMKDNGSVPKDAGYEYTTVDGRETVEFHVDDCKTFSKHMNQTTAYGGDRSSLFINAPTSLVDQWVKDGMFTDENEPSKAGYKYDSVTGESMTEVHALHFKDDGSTRVKLKQLLADNQLAFNISVRPVLIIFGQDEAIFKQYLMTLKVWLGRGGKQPLRPKDEGMGLMASAMKCRDFGFGYTLTEDQIQKTNKFRKEQRPNYPDKAASTKVYGSEKKPDLKTSPFLTIFDYGKNADGYWTYDRMVCQLVDCIDVLDALYSVPPNGSPEQRHMTNVPNTRDRLVRLFDYGWLFDHSCGHDRKKPDGLDVIGLTKGPSPNARKMRKVLIDRESGILGPYVHPKRLKVGMYQNMVVDHNDNFGDPETGPVHQSLRDGYTQKFDVPDPNQPSKEVDKNCDELRNDLESKRMDTGGKKNALVDRCIAAGVYLLKS